MAKERGRATLGMLRTRLPWSAAAYLLVEAMAGWAVWLCMATIVLVPVWALAWARVERRLVTWTGLDPIPRWDSRPPRAPASGPATMRLREIAFVLLQALVSVLAVVAVSCVWAVAAATLAAPFRPDGVPLGPLLVTSTTGRWALFGVGVLGVVPTLWLAAAVARGLARIATVLLSPPPEHLVATLVERAVDAQDDLVLERRLMEQRLHDGAQVHLSAAGLRLGLLELRLTDAGTPPDPYVVAALREIRDEVEAAADAVREAAHGLTPRVLGEEGLAPALRELAAELPLETRVTQEGASPDGAAAESLYLIASEAITNALRHGGCSRIDVELVGPGASGAPRADRVRLTVRDDGVGGAERAGVAGRGILGMAARARRLGGTLELTSPDGGPTTVVVDVPMAPDYPAGGGR